MPNGRVAIASVITKAAGRGAAEADASLREGRGYVKCVEVRVAQPQLN